MPPSTAPSRIEKQQSRGKTQVSRVQKVQGEIVSRYDRIVNLWISFHNSGKYVDEFSREFYHAVGRILQGAQLTPEDLTIEFHEVVSNQQYLANGGHKRDKESRQAAREVSR